MIRFRILILIMIRNLTLTLTLFLNLNLILNLILLSLILTLPGCSVPHSVLMLPSSSPPQSLESTRRMLALVEEVSSRPTISVLLIQSEAAS